MAVEQNPSCDALYYPNISLQNPSWLKAMALYYDTIYRLVPAGVVPDDDPQLQPLLEDRSIGRFLDPSPYAELASSEFREKLASGEWDAAALTFSPAQTRQIERIHEGKMDEKVRLLFQELGFDRVGEWFHIPTDLASNYMLYLATKTAERNNLELITHEWGAWTGSSYFRLNGAIDESVMGYAMDDKGESSTSLFGLVLTGLVPINIDEIRAEEIVRFRDRRKDEMSLLRNSIGALHAELQSVEHPQLRMDVIQRKIDGLAKSMEDFRRSADIIRAKGWFGISLMGLPAPTVLGPLLGLSPVSTTVLAAAGIAMGGIYNLSSKNQELRKLRGSNPASYFCDLEDTFKNYTNVRGGGDINYHAYNCLEEYVND